MTTVTASDVANALNYLLAARALTVVDGQAQVWWDYLTHEIDNLQAGELLPACRRVIRDWGRDRRAWQVDVERYAAAVRVLRRERMEAATAASGSIPRPAGLAGEPAAEAAWMRAWIEAVQAGHDDPQQAAWRAVGRTPPPAQVTAGGPSGRDAARAVLQRLASTHTINR